MNGLIERVGGSTKGVWMSAHQVAAYQSLARSRGVEFADVVRAAEDGDLSRIIELRDLAKERRIQDGHIRRIEHLYRMKVLGILQERDLMLREREL